MSSLRIRMTRTDGVSYSRSGQLKWTKYKGRVVVVSRPYQADRAEKGPKKMSDKIKKEREEDKIRSEQSEFQQKPLCLQLAYCHHNVQPYVLVTGKSHSPQEHRCHRNTTCFS